jgi:hypothetical protein
VGVEVAVGSAVPAGDGVGEDAAGVAKLGVFWVGRGEGAVSGATADCRAGLVAVEPPRRLGEGAGVGLGLALGEGLGTTCIS